MRRAILSALRKRADEGEEAKPSGGKGGVSSNFLQFMEEVGDQRVRNPDTGNEVYIKSLNGPKGKKLVQKEFKRWLDRQKDEGAETADSNKKAPTEAERMAREDSWEDDLDKIDEKEVHAQTMDRELGTWAFTKGKNKRREKVDSPSTGKEVTILALSRSKKPEDQELFKELHAEWQDANRERAEKLVPEALAYAEAQREQKKGSRKNREGSNWAGKMRRPSEAAQAALRKKLGGQINDPWGQVRNDPDLLRITSEGKKMSPKGMLKVPMVGGECHWNTSKLFKQGKVDQIVIGYAKGPYGWHQHTWGMKDGKVVETTEGNFDNSEFFGLPLEGEEAGKFAEWVEKNPPGGGVVRMMSA